MAAVVARFGRLDVLVNNAGVGLSGVVADLDPAALARVFDVNVMGSLHAIQAALPTMRAQGRGHVVNVSSLLGRVPLAPQRAAYSAAKHALNALTASLRIELRDEWPQIHVSSVHPGVVATEFGLSALHGGVDSRALPGAQSAEEVAAVIAEVIERPRADVYTRPGAQQMIAGYYAAEDMAAAESGFGRG